MGAVIKMAKKKVYLKSRDALIGRGSYLKVKVARAMKREDELFDKVHKFKKQPLKAKRLGINNKSYGKWIKRKNIDKKTVEKWLKARKNNEKYYD